MEENDVESLHKSAVAAQLSFFAQAQVELGNRVRLWSCYFCIGPEGIGVRDTQQHVMSCRSCQFQN